MFIVGPCERGHAHGDFLDLTLKRLGIPVSPCPTKGYRSKQGSVTSAGAKIDLDLCDAPFFKPVARGSPIYARRFNATFGPVIQ